MLGLNPYAAELLAERRMKDLVQEAERERLIRIAEDAKKGQTGLLRVRPGFKSLLAGLANRGVDRPRPSAPTASSPNRKGALSS